MRMKNREWSRVRVLAAAVVAWCAVFSTVGIAQQPGDGTKRATPQVTTLRPRKPLPVVRARPIHWHPERRLALVNLSAVRSAGTNRFRLMGRPGSTGEDFDFCQFWSEDEYGTRIYNCFVCHEEGTDLWHACKVVGFCVEGYNLNSSVCHWYD